MPCFHPISAYQSLTERTPNGKSVIVFKKPDLSSPYTTIELPCSQCIGCRIDRSRSWALRCVHEASLFTHNCFITLTFNPAHINEHGTLVKADFQKFIKRLRKKYSGIDAVSTSGTTYTLPELVKIKSEYGSLHPNFTKDIKYPIRYFHCGEYGSELNRPHHHACLFNFDFLDKKLWSIRDGVRLYRSPSLDKLWPFGYCTVGAVTYQSAAYVARYITKKVNGELAKSHYRRLDKSTGEIWHIEPEYITMSRRPGIGRRFFDKYKSDLYPKDFITHNGKKFKAPKYYDKIYDSIDPESLDKIKNKRKLDFSKHSSDNTKQRLSQREKVLLSKCKILKRELENEKTNVLNL